MVLITEVILKYSGGVMINKIWTNKRAYLIGMDFYNWFKKQYPHPNARPKSKRIVDDLQKTGYGSMSLHVFMKEIKYTGSLHFRYEGSTVVHKKYSYSNGDFTKYKIFGPDGHLIKDDFPKARQLEEARELSKQRVERVLNKNKNVLSGQVIGQWAMDSLNPPIPAPSNDGPVTYIVKKDCPYWPELKEISDPHNKDYFTNDERLIFIKGSYIRSHPEWFEVKPKTPAIVSLYREFRDFVVAPRSCSLPYHPNSYIEAESIAIINDCIQYVNEQVNKLMEFKRKFVNYDEGQSQ